MFLDIERVFEHYFPEQWSSEELQKFLGDSRFVRDREAIQQTINVPIRELFFRGGKRLRSALLFTLLQGFDINPRGYEEFGIIIELVHNGTLVADDIEDSSELRRGKASLHKMLGLDIAVNIASGMLFIPVTMLLNHSKKISGEQRLRLFEIYSEEMTNVHMGQGIDISWHRTLPDHITREMYLEMCRLKTGSLMRMSARFACVLAEQDIPTEETLKRFAESVGIVFQIKDDALDLTAIEETFGKPYGNDIREGKLSLPVILALEELAQRDKGRLRAILQQHPGQQAKELIDEARALIMKTNAVDRAIEYGHTLFVDAWKEIEDKIPNKEGQERLRELTKSFIRRER
ncbi:MAG: polyprenyl synthetase family protein [Candidatus Andersenbacteria bacterium]